jgi:hypothetical protein
MNGNRSESAAAAAPLTARAQRAPLRDFCARLPPSATPRRSPQPASPVCVRRCRDSKQAVTLTHKVANQVQKEGEKKRSATHMRCTRAQTKSPRHGHQHTQVETREPRSAACHVHQKAIHPPTATGLQAPCDVGSTCAAQGSRTNYRTRCGRSLFCWLTRSHSVGALRCLQPCTP